MCLGRSSVLFAQSYRHTAMRPIRISSCVSGKKTTCNLQLHHRLHVPKNLVACRPPTSVVTHTFPSHLSTRQRPFSAQVAQSQVITDAPPVINQQESTSETTIDKCEHTKHTTTAFMCFATNAHLVRRKNWDPSSESAAVYRSGLLANMRKRGIHNTSLDVFIATHSLLSLLTLGSSSKGEHKQVCEKYKEWRKMRLPMSPHVFSAVLVSARSLNVTHIHARIHGQSTLLSIVPVHTFFNIYSSHYKILECFQS